MAVEFEILSYVRSRKGGLRPDIPVTAGSAGAALRTAARLSETKDLVIAVIHDDALGRSILLAYGDVPDGLMDG